MTFFGTLKSGNILNVEEEAIAVVAKENILIRLQNFITEKKKRKE